MGACSSLEEGPSCDSLLDAARACAGARDGGGGVRAGDSVLEAWRPACREVEAGCTAVTTLRRGRRHRAHGRARGEGWAGGLRLRRSFVPVPSTAGMMASKYGCCEKTDGLDCARYTAWP
eukprot:6192003-Pleurochrysis_carterae.AAC.2